MKGEQLRAILSIIVLGCGLKFGYDLFQERIIPAVNITNLKNPVELNSFSQGLLNISLKIQKYTRYFQLPSLLL